MVVDLRSDTVTKPSKDMLDAMYKADLGDDVFGEDPTVKALEEKTAAMFGMEAGLFCPSGTMANQIAIKAQTNPLDEIICDKLSHIYNYETAGYAFHSGVSIRLTEGKDGIITTNQIEDCILPDKDWYANSKMVCIENTVNKGGGAVYTLEEMKSISRFCRDKNLVFHLDGARIFNALTYLKIDSKELKGLFDSISICLSKGLGTPVGSVLVSTNEVIKKARKIRKVMGGGMRQSGLLAAAGLFAIENNINRLDQDHFHAQKLADTLSTLNWVRNVLPTKTNIVIVEVEDAEKKALFLESKGVKSSPFSKHHLRFVTHLDITNEMIDYTIAKFKEL
jgi:threonine aldolase